MVCLGNEQSQMETMFIIEITISSYADMSFNFFYINFCFIILSAVVEGGVTLSKQSWAAQNVLVKLT